MNLRLTLYHENPSTRHARGSGGPDPAPPGFPRSRERRWV